MPVPISKHMRAMSLATIYMYIVYIYIYINIYIVICAMTKLHSHMAMHFIYILSPKEQGSKHQARADNKGMVAPRARKWESGEHNGLHHTECT